MNVIRCESVNLVNLLTPPSFVRRCDCETRFTSVIFTTFDAFVLFIVFEATESSLGIY